MKVPDQPLLGVHVVVPTISRSRAEHAANTWLARLAALGATYVIVANNRAVLDAAVPDESRIVSSRGNPGFAASVNFGAASWPNWSVLCVFNDDLQMPDEVPKRLAAAIAELSTTSSAPILMSFDPEPARRIPGLGEVFLNVSLLEAVARKFSGLGHAGIRDPAPSTAVTPVAPGTYHSFSAVAFTRPLWDLLGPLDERYVFCYEDAAYSLHALATASVRVAHRACGIVHEHSATSSRHIDQVLPATVASAREYLVARGVSPWLARATIASALVVRLFLAPTGRADVSRHVEAIRSAFWQTSKAPRRALLPPFEETL